MSARVHVRVSSCAKAFQLCASAPPGARRCCERERGLRPARHAPRLLTLGYVILWLLALGDVLRCATCARVLLHSLSVPSLPPLQ
jgi:hypothetical protein